MASDDAGQLLGLEGVRRPIDEERRLLSAARLWLVTICELAEIDPDETTMRARAVGKDGERIVAMKSLSETIAEIDAILGDTLDGLEVSDVN